jgi:uncharacterized membrane protein YoaK (UPF0700 family)
MFHRRNEAEYSARNYFHWFLLAFLSGCVNAGGYLACHRFVSHVTGFATLFGISLAQGKVDAAVGIMTVPAYFLFGVMISAYLVDKREHEGKHPHYATVMLLVFACLMLVAVGGHYGFFSPFDGELRLKRDYFMLALLCMASGLQNAAVTTATGARVRTTHLTGITTDLGLGLVRQHHHGISDSLRLKERKANRLRVGTIAAFAIGSAVSAAIFMELKFLGFLLPAALALYAALVAKQDRH